MKKKMSEINISSFEKFYKCKFVSKRIYYAYICVAKNAFDKYAVGQSVFF